MYQGIKDLEFLKEIYPALNNLYKEFEVFYANIEELSSELSSIMSGVEYSEEDLNEVEKKLLDLNRLKNKYKTDLHGVINRREEFEKESQALLNMDLSIKEKERLIKSLLGEYTTLNHQLRDQRDRISKPLSTMVEKELEKLEMKRAVFKISMEKTEPTMHNISPDGTDFLEFYLSSNPGQKPGKIKEGASGGELSRAAFTI